jgi:GntP family gluconate:H+ symporter
LNWTGHDSALLAIAGGATLGLVLLVAVVRLHPLIALVVASLALGLGSGLAPESAALAFQKGFGDTLGNVGVVLGLGAMLGRLMAESGAADRIVGVVVGRAPPRAVPWAMAGAALVIGIPMFFEIGVVLLMPMMLAAARRSGGSLLRVGIPALAALSVLHGLLPPHPAPLLCAGVLHADLGATMGLGLLVALPTVALAGPVFGMWIGRRIDPHPPEALGGAAPSSGAGDSGSSSSAGVAFATIVLPVALMLGRTVVALTGAQGPPAHVASFVGHPIVAMLTAVVVAGFAFSRARGVGSGRVAALVGESLGPIGAIVMIIGAGGGFKQMLIDSGVGGAIAKAAHGSSMSPLLLAWLVAATIRVATGSATVATVSASGIIAPIVSSASSASSAASLGHESPALLTLAIGAGSLFFSHVNDAGFWLVKECFGMSVGETVRSWSAMETIISVFALGCIFVLARFV